MLMMFWIFLVVDLVTVGIFYAVYGKKWEYAEGMLMGVHIPQSAADSEEVKALMAAYRKRSSRFYLWNCIACVLICALNFWYISIFMIVWSVWLVELCAGAIALPCVTHRKLYDLKMERGWIGCGGSRILAADTKTSAQSGKMGASPWWHMVCLGLVLMPCILPDVRKYLAETEDGWIYLFSGVLISILFFALQMIFRRMGNKVYSEDGQINLEMNRMQKSAWAWALLGGDVVNVAAWLFIAAYMDGREWIGSGVLTIYIILQSIPPLFIIAAFVYIGRRKKHLLARNEKPLYIDDDVYWKNGWYSNPNDKRLIVQDWMCSWNYTSNMARPAAKVAAAIGLSFLVIGLPVLCAMMLKIDFTPIELHVGTEQVQITSGYSDVELDYEDILGVQILNELPEDDYRRVNGSADQRMLIGKFRGKETGKCRMYLYIGYEPVLELKTQDGPVYVNSRIDGEVRAWYDKISGRTESLLLEEGS